MEPPHNRQQPKPSLHSGGEVDVPTNKPNVLWKRSMLGCSTLHQRVKKNPSHHNSRTSQKRRRSQSNSKSQCSQLTNHIATAQHQVFNNKCKNSRLKLLARQLLMRLPHPRSITTMLLPLFKLHIICNTLTTIWQQQWVLMVAS